MIDSLISKMQTRCAGRYIFDLPRELDVAGEIRINDVQISSEKEDLRSFNAMLVRREYKLKNTKSRDKHPFFYQEGQGASDNTKYFISRGYTDNDPSVRKIEAYKWDNGYAIKIEAEATDFTDPDQTSDLLVQKISVKNDVPKKLEMVIDCLDRVRGRSEDDIPSQPGVCFFGGFVEGAACQTENVQLVYSLLQKPDVIFTFSTDTDIHQDTTLLQRAKSLDGQLLQLNTKTLRKGVVNFPDLAAEEWLTSTNTIMGTPGHYLTLEANSGNARWSSPLLILDLETGVMGNTLDTAPETASLNDKEVVALWDAVSRTLRPRPNAF